VTEFVHHDDDAQNKNESQKRYQHVSLSLFMCVRRGLRVSEARL